MAADSPKPVEITVDSMPEVAGGAYSNLAVVNHAEGEFVLDFLYVQPGRPNAVLKSRVVTSPQHFKRLLAACQENVKTYEERYGTIVLAEDRVPYS
jgi:hypothetical protein